jgi:hypothetical protein
LEQLPHAASKTFADNTGIASFLFLGTFERLREFIRKPYVIGEYMYANGILVEEYPLYQQTGILMHTPYSAISEITEEIRLLPVKRYLQLPARAAIQHME